MYADIILNKAFEYPKNHPPQTIKFGRGKTPNVHLKPNGKFNIHVF